MPPDLPNPLLTEDTLDQIGRMNADLLSGEVGWVHRRRERVEILDETALRRQVSIDFTLPAMLDSVSQPELGISPAGVPIYAAPIIFLEKRPRELMNFDLVDETGRSLPLMTSADNGQVSAATLKEICSRRLNELKREELPEEVAERLGLLATTPLAEALRWAERLRSPLPSDADTGVGRLLVEDELTGWWIGRLADSSIVIALYEAGAIQRKIIKLSYEEPIDSILPGRALLGWAPYTVRVDSPFVSAQTYHMEVTAPEGLRVTEAGLIDERRPSSETVIGFNRRVHLYLSDAERSGSATAQLRLRVSGPGFIGGAVLAALLVPAVLFTLALSTDEIASNPTSVPALLLLLPGLLTTHVARPDQHALTTRLLAHARWLLLFSGLLAYAMALRLAVSGPAVDRSHREALSDRADAFAVYLYPAAGLAALVFVALGITWMLSHPLPRGMTRAVRGRIPRIRVDRFTISAALRVVPASAVEYLVASDESAVLRAEEPTHDASDEIHELRFIESHRGWTWSFTVRVQPAPEGSSVLCEGRYSGRWGLGLLAPVAVRWRLLLVRHRLERLAKSL